MEARCTLALVPLALILALSLLPAAASGSTPTFAEDFSGATDPLTYWYQDPGVSQDSFGWDSAADNMWGEARRGQNVLAGATGTAERAYESFSAAGYGDCDQYLEYTEDFDFSFDLRFSAFVASANDERLLAGLWYSLSDAQVENAEWFTRWANRQHFVGVAIEEDGTGVRLTFFFGNGGDWSGRAVSDDLTGAGSLSTGVNYRVVGHYRWDGTTYGQVFGDLINVDTGAVVGSIAQQVVTQDTDIYSVAYANFTGDTANRRFLKLGLIGVGNETWGATRQPGPQFRSDNWTLTLYDPVALTSINVYPSANAVYVGHTGRLFCEAYDAGGTRYDVSSWVHWISLDPAIVSIDEETLTATGVAVGSTQVKATFAALETPLASFDVLPARTPHTMSYGLDVILQWRDLAKLKPGTEAGLASSYDRNGTINNSTGDYNWYDQYSYQLTTDVDPVTVRQLSGRPGLITRTWMPWLPGPEFKLKYHFDGETTPRLNTNTMEWYDLGVPGHAGIEEPFVGNGQGSGGAWCYNPLWFETGLKIVSQNRAGLLNFYQMNYLLLPPGTDVTTYTALQPTGDRADWNLAAEVLEACGDNPGPAGATVIHTSGEIASSGTLVLADLDTGHRGTITRLQIKLSSPSDAQLAGARLKITYPDLSGPAVDVAIGEFFGAGRQRIAYRALALGTDHDDGFYCYHPMPFRRGVRVEIVNDSAETVTVAGADVEYDLQELDALCAYFHASRRQETFAPGVDAMYTVLNVPDGAGHYLGCMMTVSRSPEDSRVNYLEGNDYIEVDGGAKQTLRGTGMEDAFNGGYYYSAPFDTPFAGLLVKLATGTTSQYRHQIIDFVPFEESILVQFQAVDSWGQEFQRTYETTAFWYQQPPAIPALNISRLSNTEYYLTWSPAGAYDLQFDTEWGFPSPDEVDVTGLTEYTYFTPGTEGHFRLKLK